MTAEVPKLVGVGLKPQHYRVILEEQPAVGFFEVHAENYMGAGGPPHRHLEAIRARYPLSLHGVALSIGGAQPLDRGHLARLKTLITRYEPGVFSEHLAWCAHGGSYLNDLLPLPYTEDTLANACRHIDELQEFLGRRMLLENPATYVRFAESAIPEPEFVSSVVSRTGCGMLLDVNNVYVSAVNHDYDPYAYLEALPLESVAEVHLAGFAVSRDAAGRRLLIDHHGSRVDSRVWALYAHVLHLIGPTPTLIEWDNDVPEWPTLLAEANQAERLLRGAARQRNARREGDRC